MLLCINCLQIFSVPTWFLTHVFFFFYLLRQFCFWWSCLSVLASRVWGCNNTPITVVFGRNRWLSLADVFSFHCHDGMTKLLNFQSVHLKGAQELWSEVWRSHCFSVCGKHWRKTQGSAFGKQFEPAWALSVWDVHSAVLKALKKLFCLMCTTLMQMEVCASLHI